MNDRRKLTLAILFVLTVGLAGISIYITNRISQNQSPTDSEASGFGDEATRDLFEVVAAEFAKKNCNVFLDKPILTAAGFDSYDTASTGALLNADIFQNAYSKECVYFYEGSDKRITLSVVPYNYDSEIKENQEALFNKWVVSQLERPADEGRYELIPYFYGSDLTTDLGECKALLFHDQNDFEVAILSYHFVPEDGCESEKMVNLNRIVASKIAEQIQVVMDAANLIREQRQQSTTTN